MVNSSVIYDLFYTSQVVQDFWTINSMLVFEGLYMCHVEVALKTMKWSVDDCKSFSKALLKNGWMYLIAVSMVSCDVNCNLLANIKWKEDRPF